MRNRIVVLAMVFLLLEVGSPMVVSAVDYPTRPIEILCPYPPGGSVDMMGRVIADIAPKYLGQPVAVVTKTGASGSVAANEVINAKPDGYKLIILTPDYFSLTTKTQKISFDPFDLIPLANFMEQKLGLFVRADSPFKTLDDLINYAKKNPGELKWGVPGRGTTMHMSWLLILKRTGVKTIEVPDKGGPEVLAAVLGGHVDAGLCPFGTVKEQVKAGKARYLIFFTDKRYSDQPDVPTAGELGFPHAILPAYFGLYVHKDTPESIKKILIDVCDKIQKDPDLKKGIEKFGEKPMIQGPEFIRSEMKKQEEIGIPILKEIGLYVGK